MVHFRDDNRTYNELHAENVKLRAMLLEQNTIIEKCASVIDTEAAYWEAERLKSIEATSDLREQKGTALLSHEAYWAAPEISEQGHIHRARDVLQNAAALIRQLKTN